MPSFAPRARYNPNVTGAVGEIGLMQVRPSTARLLGFTGSLEELREPHTNIALGVAYLAGAWRLANGDICTAVMKYRAGHGETRFSERSIDYCVRVRSYLAEANYPVTGEVPSPTVGFVDIGPRWGFGTGTVAAARRLASHTKLKSRVAWGAYDREMKSFRRPCARRHVDHHALKVAKASPRMPAKESGPAGRSVSRITEGRWALGDESRHPFLLVLGREHRVENAPLEADAFGERRLIGAVDAFLRHHDDRQGKIGDRLGGFHRLGHELGRGHDA